MRLSDAFRNEKGAFDLPSIMIGVAVVAILTVGVLAAIFGVIPWAQDNAAKQDVSAIVTAQGVYNAQIATGQIGTASDGLRYGSLEDLVNAELLSAELLDRDGLTVNATGSVEGSTFTVEIESDTGKIFMATDKAPTPVLKNVTP